MKLSELRGERALDVMADAMELAGKLADGGELAEIVEAASAADGDRSQLLMAMCRILPRVIRAHKREVVALMAEIEGVDADEYAESGDVVGDVIALLTTDTEAVGFLA